MNRKRLLMVAIGLATLLCFTACPNPAGQLPTEPDTDDTLTTPDTSATPKLVLVGYVIDELGQYTAGQWVDGQWQAYQGNSAIVLGSFEKDGYIYAGGYCITSGGLYVPCTWVNGTISEIDEPSNSYDCSIYNVCSINGSIALVGDTFNRDYDRSQGYWLNSTWNPITLPAGIDATSASAYALTERDAVIEICGYSSGTAFIWTSSGTTILEQPEGVTDARPYKMAIEGDDTYIAGYSRQYNSDTDTYTAIPCMWTNGVPSLMDVPDGYTYAIPTSAYQVDGTSIATALCQETYGNSISQLAGYWANGVWTSLTLPAGAIGGRALSYLPVEELFCGYVVKQDGTTQPGYWESDIWHSVTLPPGAVSAYPRAVFMTSSALSTPAKDSSKGAVITAGSYNGDEAIMAINGEQRVDDSLAAVATGIALDGDDVYFSGTYAEDGSGVQYPAYWKNGERTILTIPDGSSGYAADIAIHDDMVYVSGYYDPSDGPERPCLWTNGTREDLELPDGMANTAQANRLAVVGSDVYVSGYYVEIDNTSTDDVWKICYWKNSARTDIDSVTGLPSIMVFGIAASGSDVYVCGASNDGSGNLVPTYWNVSVDSPVQTTLSAGSATKAGIVDMLVSDGSIRAVGTYYDGTAGWMPAYWTDGALTTLETDGTGTGEFQVGIALALDGSDVYVAGMRGYGDEGEFPSLWKNGSIVDLYSGEGYGCMLDVAVKRY